LVDSLGQLSLLRQRKRQEVSRHDRVVRRSGVTADAVDEPPQFLDRLVELATVVELGSENVLRLRIVGHRDAQMRERLVYLPLFFQNGRKVEVRAAVRPAIDRGLQQGDA